MKVARDIFPRWRSASRCRSCRCDQSTNVPWGWCGKAGPDVGIALECPGLPAGPGSRRSPIASRAGSRSAASDNPTGRRWVPRVLATSVRGVTGASRASRRHRSGRPCLLRSGPMRATICGRPGGGVRRADYRQVRRAMAARWSPPRRWCRSSRRRYGRRRQPRGGHNRPSGFGRAGVVDLGAAEFWDAAIALDDHDGIRPRLGHVE